LLSLNPPHNSRHNFPRHILIFKEFIRLSVDPPLLLSLATLEAFIPETVLLSGSGAR